LIKPVVAFLDMRWYVFLCAVLAICPEASPKDRRLAPPPNQFEIARHTFFDFGPPNDFYELFFVRPTESGTSIERITLTPPGNACIQPATIETRSASIGESIATLLGGTNPCSIPEKKLRRELKRCKKCLVFSGANVAMQVRCGDQTRAIRSDILDRDMFDPAANTPEHTSWTMRLLARLNQAIGPGVMERPIFTMPGPESSAALGNSETVVEVGLGKYDNLFQGPPDKPSDLYRAAQKRPPTPTVQLISISPIRPELFVEPGYPPLARLAHIEGVVVFKADIDPNGHPANLIVESGHPMLRGVVEKAVSTWQFPKVGANEKIQGTIEFRTNCALENK